MFTNAVVANTPHDDTTTVKKIYIMKNLKKNYSIDIVIELVKTRSGCLLFQNTDAASHESDIYALHW